MKSIVLLILLCFSNCTFGQDLRSWTFNIIFKIDTKEITGYAYKDVEVFSKDTYSNEILKKSPVKFDSLTNEYEVFLMYTCICSNPNPEIYLKIKSENNISGDYLSTIIPIYFVNFKKVNNFAKSSAINLGTIVPKHFLTNNNHKDEDDSFKIIEIESINSIRHIETEKYTSKLLKRLSEMQLQVKKTVNSGE